MSDQLISDKDFSALIKGLKKMYGLFFLEREGKFLLVSVLKGDGSLHDISNHSELLRIYAIDEDNAIAEFKDVCTIYTLENLNQTLSFYSKKYNKIKIVYSNDNCETIEEFYADKMI